ncbi:hypothetical protein, partial [Pseudomonas sivasensis]
LHKHPHELLDSVVKERLVKIFRLNRGAHSTANAPQVTPLKAPDFINKINYLGQKQHQAARQREANITALKYVVNPRLEILFPYQRA